MGGELQRERSALTYQVQAFEKVERDNSTLHEELLKLRGLYDELRRENQSLRGELSQAEARHRGALSDARSENTAIQQHVGLIGNLQHENSLLHQELLKQRAVEDAMQRERSSLQAQLDKQGHLLKTLEASGLDLQDPDIETSIVAIHQLLQDMQRENDTLHHSILRPKNVPPSPLARRGVNTPPGGISPGSLSATRLLPDSASATLPHPGSQSTLL